MQRRDDPPELLPLFDAIAAAPDDDAPRQVLADALQERGDPRGEFIALQLLVAAGKATPDQHSQMLRLQSKHARQWLSELPGVGPAPGGTSALTEFSRGFLKSASLSLTGLGADSPGWRMVERLQVISEGTSPSELTSPWLSRLESLTGLDFDALRAVTLGPDRPRLTRLGYRGPNVELARRPQETAILHALPRFAALRHLRLQPTPPRHHADWFDWLFAAPIASQLETLELVMDPPWDVAGLHALLVSNRLERLRVATEDLAMRVEFDQQRVTLRFTDAAWLSRRAQMVRNLVPRISPFPFVRLAVFVGESPATKEQLARLGPVVAERA